MADWTNCAQLRSVRKELTSRAAIQFLTKTGQTCTDLRQEFILLSDAFGVSALVDTINHPKPPGATESTVLGPFFVEDARTVSHTQTSS